jgi:hypothetical protein
MLLLSIILLAFPLAIINSKFSQLLAEKEAGKVKRQEKRRKVKDKEQMDSSVQPANGESVTLVWRPFGDTEPVTLVIPRSVISLLLANADVEARLREAGWKPNEDVSWTSLSGASESFLTAMRTMVMGKVVV